MSAVEIIEENGNSSLQRKRNYSTMFIYAREFIFLFALLITSYATLFNSVPKVGKAPPPTPFFPASSVINDYYRGTMTGAFEQANQADVAVVMFYAPWDADSQAARPVIDAVARFLKDEVYFAAVSCWSPTQDCKQHYPKIRSYPVIVAYPQQGSGIQYKGPLVAGHIVRFIKTLLRPVHRVHSPQDLASLFNSHEAVVLGSFDFEGNLGGRGYFVFFSAALKMLEYDFSHEIAFAVTTSAKEAASVDIEQIPSLRLYLWNSTIDYSLDDDYSEDAVTGWVARNMRRSSQWLHLPGTKSMALNAYVSAGPTLVVFTPGNPLIPVHPVYSQIRELSLRYSNCDKNAWTEHIADNLESFNRGLQSKYQRQELFCAKLRQNKKIRDKQLSAMTSAVISANALNNRTCSTCSTEAKIVGPQLEVCIRPSSSPSNFSAKIRYDTSMWRAEMDDLGAKSLLSSSQADDCKLLEAAHALERILHPPVSPSSGRYLESIACASNSSLSFVVLDSLLHYQLAEGLGVDVLNSPDKTAAVIVDAKKESHYLLREPLSQESLVQFIANFTEGTLVRHTRSTEDAKSRSLTRHSYRVVPNPECNHTNTQSCIPELHSRSFLPTVMDPTKAVIVMYHSPLCAICRSISHIVLLLARYFRHFPGLKFVRIDGERNDLPWEYTMESYPTILFFPTHRKSESRVFSDQLPFTVRTLMHFVLANLEPEAKVPAMISLCKSFEQQQTAEEARSCKTKVQTHVQEGLAHSLSTMRSILARIASTSPGSTDASLLYSHKTRAMRSLQYFRAVGLLLGSVEVAGDAVSSVLKLYSGFVNR